MIHLDDVILWSYISQHISTINFSSIIDVVWRKALEAFNCDEQIAISRCKHIFKNWFATPCSKNMQQYALWTASIKQSNREKRKFKVNKWDAIICFSYVCAFCNFCNLMNPKKKATIQIFSSLTFNEFMISVHYFHPRHKKDSSSRGFDWKSFTSLCWCWGAGLWGFFNSFECFTCETYDFCIFHVNFMIFTCSRLW